jgi:ribosomal protein uL24
MKRTFSTAWVASRQVRKQRKYSHNAPLHIRHTFLSAPLSKELRLKYKKRNIRPRVGDEVKVLRGSFAGKTAKISKVNIKLERITLDGVTRQKKDGTKLSIAFHPSKVQILSLKTDDKERMQSLERNGGNHAPNKIRAK